jgi:hypothetical protein
MSTTLFEAPPPKPHSKVWKYIAYMLPLVVLAALVIFAYRNYPEERAVNRFLSTLQKGEYHEAYRLWQASPSYSYQDFLRDWGEQGDYGRIREFKVLGSQSKGSRTVIVTVKINNVDPPMQLAVDRDTKGFAYSIF